MKSVKCPMNEAQISHLKNNVISAMINSLTNANNEIDIIISHLQGKLVPIRKYYRSGLLTSINSKYTYQDNAFCKTYEVLFGILIDKTNDGYKIKDEIDYNLLAEHIMYCTLHEVVAGLKDKKNSEHEYDTKLVSIIETLYHNIPSTVNYHYTQERVIGIGCCFGDHFTKHSELHDDMSERCFAISLAEVILSLFFSSCLLKRNYIHYDVQDNEDESEILDSVG